jgi:hypothetical protein
MWKISRETEPASHPKINPIACFSSYAETFKLTHPRIPLAYCSPQAMPKLSRKPKQCRAVLAYIIIVGFQIRFSQPSITFSKIYIYIIIHSFSSYIKIKI